MKTKSQIKSRIDSLELEKKTGFLSVGQEGVLAALKWVLEK